MSVAEVWTNASARIIQASESLDIFAALSGDKAGQIELPSWVPYWADCFPHGRPIAAPAVTSFCASRGLPHVWTPNHDPAKLRVKEKAIDEVFGDSVNYQGPTLPFGEFMSYKHDTHLFLWWDCRLQDLRRYHYRDPPVEKAYGCHLPTKFESAESDLMRICLADGAVAAEQPLREKVCELLDLNAQAGLIQNLRKEKSRSAMTTAKMQLVDDYEEFENMCLIAEHKQLFATVNFQLGLAPEGLKDAYDFVEISKGSAEGHSPTPSEIVLNDALKDVAEMSALNRELRERGADKGERRRALLELQETLIAERKRVAEEAQKARQEELDREYEEAQRRGREEI
ncbi:hypothetical protein E8E12_010677 [Didymella heteroderae]|uniref:Uncharacterized protein n=1 Tax=Didymella heteroderae TaxID=1769908 RepID=A0A9P4WYQ7_9PLEO|nr:hypothetical protein E8E12_010677 [Didymella heteroderae]